ncbi:F-box domain-containing protein [Pacmanvirus A23]|uniref:F-box domain-containing protein n=1 Tax=Pacmanvirus A23 TaxID=1932881 RepID=UPI000A094A2F|nr:F-box domain-containing protein [Pacmanvirus A23]SIP85901.1 F-box domain-containing protein [Pacmanvirus A23]
MTDLIAKHAELFENFASFAKSRGVDRIETLFDFIPNEILEKILDYLQTVRVCSICKRFNDVYISLIDSKINTFAALQNPERPVINWREKIETLDILNSREITLLSYRYRYFIFHCNDIFTMEFKKDNIKHTLCIGNDVVPYVIKNNNIIYCNRLDSSIEILTGDNEKYNIISHCLDNNYERENTINIYKSAHSVCIVNSDFMSLTVPGKTINIPARNLIKIVRRGIKYYFVTSHCLDYKLFNNILLDEYSPYPIPIMGDLSDI